MAIKSGVGFPTKSVANPKKSPILVVLREGVFLGHKHTHTQSFREARQKKWADIFFFSSVLKYSKPLRFDLKRSAIWWPHRWHSLSVNKTQTVLLIGFAFGCPSILVTGRCTPECVGVCCIWFQQPIATAVILHSGAQENHLKNFLFWYGVNKKIFIAQELFLEAKTLAVNFSRILRVFISNFFCSLISIIHHLYSQFFSPVNFRSSEILFSQIHSVSPEAIYSTDCEDSSRTFDFGEFVSHLFCQFFFRVCVCVVWIYF